MLKVYQLNSIFFEEKKTPYTNYMVLWWYIDHYDFSFVIHNVKKKATHTYSPLLPLIFPLYPVLRNGIAKSHRILLT